MTGPSKILGLDLLGVLWYQGYADVDPWVAYSYAVHESLQSRLTKTPELIRLRAHQFYKQTCDVDVCRLDLLRYGLTTGIPSEIIGFHEGVFGIAACVNKDSLAIPVGYNGLDVRKVCDMLPAPSPTIINSIRSQQKQLAQLLEEIANLQGEFARCVTSRLMARLAQLLYIGIMTAKFQHALRLSPSDNLAVIVEQLLSVYTHLKGACRYGENQWG